MIKGSSRVVVSGNYEYTARRLGWLSQARGVGMPACQAASALLAPGVEGCCRGQVISADVLKDRQFQLTKALFLVNIYIFLRIVTMCLSFC